MNIWICDAARIPVIMRTRSTGAGHVVQELRALSLLRWPLPSLPRLLAILLVGRHTSTAMCCSPSNIMARSLTIEDWRIWKELTLFPSLEAVLIISWCKYEDVANTELLTFAIEYLQYLAQSRIPTCRMLKEMCLAPRPSRLPAPWASTRRSRRCSSRYGCHAIHFRTRNNIESRNTAPKSITPEMVIFSRLWSLMVLPVAWGRPPRPWTRGRPCSASSLRTATSRCTRSWSLLSARWELGFAIQSESFVLLSFGVFCPFFVIPSQKHLLGFFCPGGRQ